MTLVIMAAGMGSRYGGIKQIDPMGPHGEIILDYSVYDAIKAGFDSVLFIIRHDIESAFRETIGERFRGKIAVDYAFQELDDCPEGFPVPSGRVKPWGTGHAVLACRKAVKEPFVVINADDFYGAEAFVEGMKALEQLSSDRLEGFLVSYRLDRTLSPHGYVSRGLCETDGSGYLTKVTERLNIGRNRSNAVEYQEEGVSHLLRGDELVSMNFWGFSPQIFTALQEEFQEFLSRSGLEMKSEYLMPTVVDRLISRGEMRMRVFESAARWFGVTYPEDKPMVKRTLAELVQGKIYPSPLW